MAKTIVVYALDENGKILHLELFPFLEDGSNDKEVAESFRKASEKGGEAWMSAIEQLTIQKLNQND